MQKDAFFLLFNAKRRLFHAKRRLYRQKNVQTTVYVQASMAYVLGPKGP
jgi:hypothetical protein